MAHTLEEKKEYADALKSAWAGNKQLDRARELHNLGQDMGTDFKYHLELITVANKFNCEKVKSLRINIKEVTGNPYIDALIFYEKEMKSAYAGNGMLKEDFLALHDLLDRLAPYGIGPKEHMNIEAGLCGFIGKKEE